MLIIGLMNIKFKKKWHAILYSKLMWLKTELTTRDIILHKYSTIILYPEKTWTINRILVTNNDNKKN